MVAAWADSWSRQSVEDYLDHYAAEFQPPGGVPRERWEAERRDRILRPASINVTLADVEVLDTGPDRRVASFVQYYTSDVFSDVVVKTLELVWEREAWRIASERVEGPG